MEIFRTGEVVGNGAAINIELGWVPDRVEVYNATDGDIVTVGFCNRQVIPFTSGGVNEIKVGDKITGVTSKATATVKQIELYSGSWAGGDAAGFFIVERDTIVGTFQAENVIGVAAGAADDATVTANVTHSYKIDTATAAVTTTSALLPYGGVAASNAKGFIIGSVVAEEAKILRWSAWRNFE